MKTEILKIKGGWQETSGGVLTGDIQERYGLYNAYFNACRERGQQDG